jgi:ATP adenylyltransferase
MENCPFCEIKKEDRILKEGKFSYVFLSNPRLMLGHILITPKRHVTRIPELTREEQNEIFDFLVEFQTKILEKIFYGCEIRQNFKPYLKEGRTHVTHMHFHILPREPEDELQGVEKGRTALYRDFSQEEKEKLMNLLK